MADIPTRMGDGEQIVLSQEELGRQIATGTQEAARRAKVPPLAEADQRRLGEIFREPGRVVSVEPGQEVVTTDDSIAELISFCETNGGGGLMSSRYDTVLGWELGCGADSAALGARDFSFKPVKNILADEVKDYYSLSQQTTIPFFYGAQPNMGIYFQPDGPFPNPSELLPQGKIEEARQSQEAAAERVKTDIVFVGRQFCEAGCEGLNLDTTASAGDAEFLAALEAVRELKAQCPGMAIEMGMASEFVLGMHGGLSFDGKRLAGMFPHEQALVAQQAGVDIFGPVVNISSSRTIPWNLAYALTMIRHTCETAGIPIHANAGMGVCGIPMRLSPPIDTVSRVSKALVQIGGIDGL